MKPDGERSLKVLIVDGESDFLEWAVNQVRGLGVEVYAEGTADRAYRVFCEVQPDLVLTELNLTPFSGQELLVKIRTHTPNALVIVYSAFGTTQSVIETMKLGAFDFVRKEQLPFNLKVVVEAALKVRMDLMKASAPRPQLTVEQHSDEMVGRSDAMQQVFKLVGRVAASDVPVLITGESGTGKELVARAIHRYSQRSNKAFLAINCAAIPEQLLESELFGHEKGAFTGAHSQRIGRFEQCDEGTLFLDEIGEMPLALQSKLLRVLQHGEFSRVGGSQTIRVDVRIVAATNKQLEQEVAEKRFREDLFYRLNVVRIHLPPLRQRVEDIPLLAEYFLQRISARRLQPPLKLSEEAVRMLEGYSWPGNVRELENTLERAVVLATSDVLLAKDIPLGELGGEGVAMRRRLEEIAEQILRVIPEESAVMPVLEAVLSARVLQITSGDEGKAAQRLGIEKSALRAALRRERV
ncbi:MAG: sigma-54 dependent transcriptional regulator [Chthoniobacterales bacterium]|nr:sigma-54 dependent transcriptional regulator [Chthoniobacterales bacterium]